MIKKCKNKSETDLVKCSVCGSNWIHIQCCKSMMLTFGEDTESDFLPVCGKRCWNKALKPPPKDEAGSQRMFWHNDGSSEDVNSLSILIHWLTHEDNIVKWKGGNSLGCCKEHFGQQHHS